MLTPPESKIGFCPYLGRSRRANRTGESTGSMRARSRSWGSFPTRVSSAVAGDYPMKGWMESVSFFRGRPTQMDLCGQHFDVNPMLGFMFSPSSVRRRYAGAPVQIVAVLHLCLIPCLCYFLSPIFVLPVLKRAHCCSCCCLHSIFLWSAQPQSKLWPEVSDVRCV